MTSTHCANAIDETAAETSAAALDTRDRCPRVVSIALATLVTFTVLVGMGVERLPTLGWVAAFLFFVIEHDVRTLRIPNGLNAVALLAVLANAIYLGGLEGLGTCLLGAGVAFVVLFPLFALRWMGAGDVKAMMVLTAFLGAQEFPSLLWWMLVTGGGIAIGLLIVRGGLPDLFRRWGQTLKTLILTFKLIYIPPQPGSVAASGLPFGVAMGLGLSAHFAWGFSWLQ